MTSAVALPQVDEAVDRAAQSLREHSFVCFVGEPASGRSTALRRLKAGLATSGWRTLDVSLRQARGCGRHVTGHAQERHTVADDAAGVALIELAGQLVDQAPGILARMTAIETPWQTKLDAVRDAIETTCRRSTQVALLFDEPFFGTADTEATSVFTDRAKQLTDDLLGINDLRRVVAVRQVVPAAVAVQIRPGSDARAFLARERWNGHSTFAAALLDQGGDRLSEMSPLELRLALTCVALGVPPSIVLGEAWRGRILGGQAIAAISDPALRKVLGGLALLRIPATLDLLTTMGVEGLSTPSRALLMDVLLYEETGSWWLHELVAHQVNENHWLKRQETLDAHRRAASWYQRRFGEVASTDDPQALRLEAECVHHLTEAGEDATGTARYFFVEQLDALGKRLSLAGRRREAVACYRRALSHEPNDAYAHHYLAFNLDWEAQQPSDVDQHYRKAIELKPRHPWYHCRLISFLIVRGRLLEANGAWKRAVGSLTPGMMYADSTVTDHLHQHVARLLLYRADLDFAAAVLGDVPGADQSAQWFAVLSRALELLREVERDEAVFPPRVDRARPWDGPHLLTAQERARVSKWWPGRVAAADKTGVHVRIAQRDQRGDAKYGWRDFSERGFRAACSRYANEKVPVPTGIYVEIIKLKGGSEQILVHDPVTAQDLGLGSITPDPDRYVRAASIAG
jgi:tetratricopeptide (TPR) repeat protein